MTTQQGRRAINDLFDSYGSGFVLGELARCIKRSLSLFRLTQEEVDRAKEDNMRFFKNELK